MSKKWIHVVFLENHKWLLHVSEEIDEHELFKECTFLYEFAQYNKPISLYTSLEYQTPLEADFHVKTYMKQYGVENVRGGTYSALYLPSTVCKTVDEELSGKQFYEMEEATALFRTIRANYDDYKGESLESEKNTLLKSLNRYYEIRTTYESFFTPLHIQNVERCNTLKCNTNILYTGEPAKQMKYQAQMKRKEIKASFDFVEDYLRRFELREPFQENKTERTRKYREFLSFNKKMLPLFRIYSNETNTSLLPVLIFHPEFVFDSFFFHLEPGEQPTSNISFQEAIECFLFFEYVKNTVLNRMEEYEFDLLQYSSTFEMETRMAIEYIDSILLP